VSADLLIVNLGLLGNDVGDGALPLFAVLGGFGDDDVDATRRDELERVRPIAAALLLDGAQARALLEVDRAERCMRANIGVLTTMWQPALVA